jgi:hypothetical protein
MNTPARPALAAVPYTLEDAATRAAVLANGLLTVGQRGNSPLVDLLAASAAARRLAAMLDALVTDEIDKPFAAPLGPSSKL